jgi:hypothetical protein
MMFKNQIGKNIEVYVDNMLVKIRAATHHVLDVEEPFNRLGSHQMK